MAQKIRWGILSTGRIANDFAEGLTAVDDAELVAVGSRRQATADEFGDQYGVPNRHASYEALANDPDVDVIYIGTPHTFHKENALLCIEAGKSVLLEKPFTINAGEAKVVIDAARAKGVFLMEAMWTRFIPAFVKLRELLAEGVIGDIRMLRAEFGFRREFDPEHRLFNPELGGGALLDVGIYPVSFSSMLFGRPQTIHSVATMGETGVDVQNGMVFHYENGEIAVLSSAIRTASAFEALIQGTEGTIRLHPRWWHTTGFTVQRGDEKEVYELPLKQNGYEYEAMEVGDCLRAGKTESAIMPLDESLALMEMLDTLRAQWGLKYPMES